MGARDGSIPYHKEERDDSGGKAPGQCLCSMRVCRPTKGHTRSSCDKACRHKHPQNQSCVGSSGRTLTTNVPMTLCDSQIRHQTHVLCGCTTFGTELKLGPKSGGNNTHCCTDKGVALARGGGGVPFWREYLTLKIMRHRGHRNGLSSVGMTGAHWGSP